MKKNNTSKGFTLIELLVVIAIIAILAVVVVLTLNPAELLRQARDSNRVSDFATLKSALSLYATDVSTSTSMNGGAYKLFTADPSASVVTSTYLSTTSSVWGFAGSELSVQNTTSSRAVDGSGWIPVNLNAISSGAPISSYPVDPVNTGTSTNLYMYAASSTSFKLASRMESVKYGTGGSGDVQTGDGGNSTSTFEAGTNLIQL